MPTIHNFSFKPECRVPDGSGNPLSRFLAGKDWNEQPETRPKIQLPKYLTPILKMVKEFFSTNSYKCGFNSKFIEE